MVLVAPEIHWNTGNIGRTCLAAGSRLHLIEPLGFSLEERQVKRAGLDYWRQVKLQVWDSFPALSAKLQIQPAEVALFAKRGRRSFRDLPAPRRLFLVFGSETQGLPRSLLDAYPGTVFHIPMRRATRSLNLSTAVGIALYESLRHCRGGTPGSRWERPGNRNWRIEENKNPPSPL